MRSRPPFRSNPKPCLVRGGQASLFFFFFLGRCIKLSRPFTKILLTPPTFEMLWLICRIELRPLDCFLQLPCQYHRRVAWPLSLGVLLDLSSIACLGCLYVLASWLLCFVLVGMGCKGSSSHNIMRTLCVEAGSCDHGLVCVLMTCPGAQNGLQSALLVYTGHQVGGPQVRIIYILEP